MTDNSTSLVFRVDDGPDQLFTSKHVDRDSVKDDIVVRELVQNALDANASYVAFHLAKVPVDEIPHIDQYKRAFIAAEAHCGEVEPPAGQQVIDRIKEAFNERGGRLSCLICSDDGHGLGSKDDDLHAIYGSGRSTKRRSGRGSVGHGHFTAFAPSDLRYVLYAGRYLDEREFFAGHAILAKHTVGQEPRSADGFIRRTGQNGQNSQLGRFADERGGERVPELLRTYLPETGCGSAVMLLGYSPLSKRNKKDPVGMIISSAVRHFLLAFFDKKLSLKVWANEEEITRAGQPEELAQLLGALPARARNKSQRTLRTLQSGILLANEDTARLGQGVRVWFRTSFEKDETRTSRVAVFRDGMWIEDNTRNHFEPRYFTGVRPFDAVVDLDSYQFDSFGALTREAEGASHMTIRPREITDTAKWQELNRRMKALQELLREHAGQVDQAPDHAPSQLLLHVSGRVRPLPKRRPPRPDSDPEQTESIPEERRLRVDPDPGPDPGEERHSPLGQESNPGPSARPNDDTEQAETKVNAGNTSGLSTSCRPVLNVAACFRVAWKGDFRNGAAGLRMILPSGTDQTSRRKISPEYLPIRVVIFTDSAGQTRVLRDQSAPLEVQLNKPPASGEARVCLDPKRASALGAADRVLTRCELVHRRPAGEQL